MARASTNRARSVTGRVRACASPRRRPGPPRRIGPVSLLRSRSLADGLGDVAVTGSCPMTGSRGGSVETTSAPTPVRTCLIVPMLGSWNRPHRSA